MRIGLVSTSCVAVPPATYGGIELVVHELAEGLVARGHAVTLYATGDSRTAAQLRFLHPQAQWPPQGIAEGRHAAWAIKEILSSRLFDVVHIHNFTALTAASELRAFPVVYTLHNSPEYELGGYFHRRVPWVRYVAVSEDQRRREVGLSNLEVIHHGLDPARYDCAELPAGYVCFIGRFAPGKGPHIAIDVAGRARVPILVAGAPDPGRAGREWATREMAHRLAASHVTYLGAVGAAEKRPLLRNARAFLAPVGWFEPFGLTLIEAMLSGCPVLAFGLGSVSELVEDGVTGFVVSYPDEMVRLLRPGGLVDRFDRLRCRARAVERFSRDRMVGEYEGAYSRAIHEHALGGRLAGTVGRNAEQVRAARPSAQPPAGRGSR